MKKVIIVTIGIIMVINVFAQTPNTFKYQTVVRNATGTVLNNQNVDFQISILETSASGSAVYVETFSITTNQFGLVNLEIGKGAFVSGDFSTINWAGDVHFIKVEVDIFDGNGLQNMGISQLLSVPYALNAKTAENVFSGDYTDLTNQPIIPTQTSDLINNSGFITSPNDADADTTNEIQDLQFIGNNLKITNNTSATNIDLSGYTNLWQENSNDIYYNSGNVGVGVNHPDGKLIVQADAGMHMDTAIFEVKNKNGKTIFAVYEEGVRVYVDDSGTKSNSNKAGFAVGGFNATKALTNNYFVVSPDSIRAYIESGSSKAGFAVGGFNATKTFTHEYLRVTDDSTRIWTEDSVAGFGVLDLSGGTETGYMHITPENYFIGENSGENLTTGYYNSTFGFETGKELTSGHHNVFMGYKSGILNTSGDNNNFIGAEAGRANTTGRYNNFVGHSAGYSNTSGRSNNIMGDRAGYGNTTGIRNIFIGDDAGYSNTIGNGNNFVGASAGWHHVSGDYNNFIGNAAGINDITGMSNNFFGNKSGYSNTSGAINNFIGDEAGYNNTTGYRNNFIGDDAGYNNTTGNDNVFVGSGSGKESLTGDQNVFVGMYSGLWNTKGNSNVFMGNRAGYWNDTASNNVAIGYQAAFLNHDGHELVIVGAHAGASNNPVNSTALGCSAFVNDSNQVRLGNSSVTSIGGYAAWSNLSDKRFKTDIKENVPGLDFILKLKPVTYHLDVEKLNEFLGIENSNMDNTSILRKQNEVQSGFLAQDVEKIAEELGYKFSGIDKPDDISANHYSLRYSAFVVPLVKAVQELKQENEELKQRNKEINNKISEIDLLKVEIDKLKQMLEIKAEK